MSSPVGYVKVRHHGLITSSLLLATIMQTLDMTIANVALPHMQGSIAATQEQMSWVLTSYIIAIAVMMPLTGWLAARFGRKRVFLCCVFGFMVSSMLCGVAQSLEQIVVFRVLQGLSGAAVTPLSQAILLDINPPERHARAMTIWSMGISIAPIFGPALGALLTEQYTWRWVFFINVPVGLLCLLGVSTFLPETQRKHRDFDFFGFITLSIAIFSLQLMLDRGPLNDWFESSQIVAAAVCGGLAFYLFSVHSASVREAFVDLHIFKDRNFFIGTVLIFVTGIPMFAPLALLPPMLQGLLGYPVLTAGLITAPRGIGMLVGTLMLGPMMRYFDTRLVIAMGFSISVLALSLMCGFFLQMHQNQIMWTGFLQGIGNGIAFVPLATLTFTTLAARYRTDASAAYNLMRNLGASMGIATVQATFIRSSQIMHARLAEHITPYDRHLQGQPDLSSTAGLIAVDGRIAQQAAMLAYLNDFKLMLVLAVACIPLVLLFRKVDAPTPLAATAAHE